MASSGYTCITCAVAFTSADLQRAHYKTDWHRYNLKRKVAELPPITAEDFKQRVLAQRAADAQARESHSQYCEVCKKAFASEKSHESHLRSKKHKDREFVKQKEAKEDASAASSITYSITDEELTSTLENLKNLKIELAGVSMDDGREKVISALQNLPEHQQQHVPDLGKQTSRQSDALPKKGSASHARGKPSEPRESAQEKKQEEDDEGLSGESDGDPEPLEVDECLFCPLVSEDMEASLKHMSSTHGFFIPDLDYLVDLKGLVEYLCRVVGEQRKCLYCQTARMFYSVEAVQHHMVDKAHCKLFFEGDSAGEYAEFYDYTKSYPPEENGGEENGEDEELPVPESPVTVNEDLELVLPSGSKLSHRSMKQYYKQRLPTLEQRRSTLVSRLMAQYRSIGWKGYEGEAGRLRLKDEAWRHQMQQKREMKLSTQANKMQHHFRIQHPY